MNAPLLPALSDNGFGNGALTPSGTLSEERLGSTGPSRGLSCDHFDSNLKSPAHAWSFLLDAPLPTLSPPMSKVKMALTTRTDSDLSSLVTNHLSLIEGKPAFANPSPAPASLLGALTDYDNALAAQQMLRDLLKAATTVKDVARKTLEDLMVARGAYVQAASGGNAMMIESVGLGVRSARSPIGPLSPPININAQLGKVIGVMKLRWKRVEDARGYLVQCSPDVQPRQFTQIKNTTKTSITLEDLPLGQRLVFRIASQGGSTGQSPWSAEVIRGVA